MKRKKNEVSTERNFHSTSDDVIKKNNLPDVQMVQQKEKQEKETTNEYPTYTTINAITTAEPLDEIIINNNSTTSIPATCPKFDIEKTKIFTPVKVKNIDNVMMTTKHSASINEDKEKLNQCITALRIWVKMSGDKQKNQTKMVKNNTYKSSQEYLGELDSKFGNTLEDKEDGIEQSIIYLEGKFKVNQH